LPDGSTPRPTRPDAKHPVRTGLRWILLAAGVGATGWLLDGLSLPSAYLFGALLVGLLVALAAPGRFDVPPWGFRAAQAVAGVTLGSYLEPDAMAALADAWLPVLLVSAGTLAVSLGAGVAFSRVTGLDAPTSALGLIAGGASGIVGMAHELGADDRLVAFMQYLRVLVVVLFTPLLIAVAFGDHHALVEVTAAVERVGPFGEARGWALTLGLAVAGAVVATRLRVPAGSLLGPMILAGILTLLVPGGELVVPPVLRELSFAVIGMQVGLRFTPEALRQIGRLALPVLLTILALLVACFGLAVLLDVTTSASLLDSYLATTPGGLYAVLAVAYGSGADITFVVGVQTLRVLVMVLLAPLAVRWMVSRLRRDPPGAPELERAREPSPRR